MSVTEVLRALGGWELQFAGVPLEVRQSVEYFGHIAIHYGEVDPGVAGDSLLTSARYVGVVRKKVDDEDSLKLAGPGMAMWLGDEDGKGDIRETFTTVTAQPFHTLIPTLLPPGGAVTAGTIFNIGGSPFTGTFQYQNPRQEIDYVAQTLGAEWRVNGNGTLDAGLDTQLFVTSPVAGLLRKEGGADLRLRGLLGTMATSQDVEDFTTRILLMTNDELGSIAVGDADINPVLNPYVDIHGNPVKMTRLVQESETSSGNATARAQLQLNRFSGTRDAVELSTQEYDLKGTVAVGDWLWVWDPETDLVDPANEVMFFGQRLNPMKLRLTEMTWPVVDGMHVSYRDGTGKWWDLSQYLLTESGDTTLVVGGYRRSLTGEEGGGVFPVTPPSPPNTTVPAGPAWVQPFDQTTYQSPTSGLTRAQVRLEWLQPANTDASAITDGDHYEIRWRSSTTPLFPVTHAQLAGFTHAQIAANGGTFGQPIVYPVVDWQYAFAGFDQLTTTLIELTPSMPYEAQIRAVDTAEPPNFGDWSTLASWQTTDDIHPPSTPAAPVCFSSTIAVQVIHTLGKATGGTFNLEMDLHHLEVHAANEPLFAPTASTLVGKMLANWAMLQGQTPVVNTFSVDALTAVYYKVVAVDEAGNRSGASLAASATPGLVDDAHISTLTVSKLTSGTITANTIHAAFMRMGTGTAGSGIGPALELTPGSIQMISSLGGLVFDLNAAMGQMRVFGNGGIRILGSGGMHITGGGNVEITDGALRIRNAGGQMITEVGECLDGRHGVQIYADTGFRVARLGELESGGHGIEVVDESSGTLVKVSTLAFGTQSAVITTMEALGNTAGGYVNLATTGPTANFTIGNTGRCIILVTCGINVQAPGFQTVGFQLSGASSVAPVGFRTVGINGTTNYTPSVNVAGVFLLTGLNAGAHSVQLKYSCTNSTLFYDRTVVVIPY